MTQTMQAVPPDKIRARLAAMVERHGHNRRAWVTARRTVALGWISEAEVVAAIGPKPADDVLAAEWKVWRHELTWRDAPPEGPGTELHELLAAWGYAPKPDCPCHARAAQMNRWGSKGCRKNYWTIVGWLKDAAAEEGGWLALAADKLGLIPGVVDKAIRNAEAKGF